MLIKLSVPGKIILSGEHAVVYGKPAIATAVDKRLTITLKSKNDHKRIIHSNVSDTKLIKAAIKIVNTEFKLPKKGYELKIQSAIPVGAGMGSSAAVAVGVTAAFVVLGRRETKLDYKLINNLAYKVEKIQHSAPSGIDNSTVTFGGFLWYRKEFEFLKTLWKLPFKIAASVNNFYLVNTGRPEETTGEMVARVSEQIQNAKLKIQNLFNQIEKQTKKLTQGLRSENEQLLMDSIRANERLLEELGVVGKFAKSVVREIEQRGGVAKISGAGGVQERSGILLIYHHNRKEVAKIARKYQLDWFPVVLGVSGVQLERISGL